MPAMTDTKPDAWMNAHGSVSIVSGGGYDIPLYRRSPSPGQINPIHDRKLDQLLDDLQEETAGYEQAGRKLSREIDKECAEIRSSIHALFASRLQTDQKET
jgi:hypothetical protein